MSIRISAGPPASPRDRLAAQTTLHLLAGELARVRAAALAWRNGIAALLAGLVGFGLIKGRTDVGELDPLYAGIVGALLLSALITGAVAAILLMRAAHGLPMSVAVRKVIDDASADPAMAGTLAEADASARALSRGVRLSFACAALLCAAVGLTWYGPAKSSPRIQVTQLNGSSHCGEVVTVVSGRLTMKTSQGRVTIDLTQADGLAAVDSCTTAQK